MKLQFKDRKCINESVTYVAQEVIQSHTKHRSEHVTNIEIFAAFKDNLEVVSASPVYNNYSRLYCTVHK